MSPSFSNGNLIVSYKNFKLKRFDVVLMERNKKETGIEKLKLNDSSVFQNSISKILKFKKETFSSLFNKEEKIIFIKRLIGFPNELIVFNNGEILILKIEYLKKEIGEIEFEKMKNYKYGFKLNSTIIEKIKKIKGIESYKDEFFKEDGIEMNYFINGKGEYLLLGDNRKESFDSSEGFNTSFLIASLKNKKKIIKENKVLKEEIIGKHFIQLF